MYDKEKSNPLLNLTVADIIPMNKYKKIIFVQKS